MLIHGGSSLKYFDVNRAKHIEFSVCSNWSNPLKRWFSAICIAMLLCTPVFGAQLLKKTVSGDVCLKNAAGTLNPVWSFKPDADATDGNFEMKFGSSATPGTTGVCPNALVLVTMDLYGCNYPTTTTQGCPNYLWPSSPTYFTYTMNATPAGNIKIPLNGPAILNLPGSQLAIQLFIGDTQGCVPPPLGFVEVHASPLVTLTHKDIDAWYNCYDPGMESQALNMVVDGDACLKTAAGTIRPVWSVEPGLHATDGDFNLKFGDDQYVPGSTGVTPNAPTLVTLTIAGCQTSVDMIRGCPFYIFTNPFYTNFLTNADAHGNIRIPLNGQTILAVPPVLGLCGRQIAMQLFIDDGPEVHASPLVTLYDLTLGVPSYYCHR